MLYIATTFINIVEVLEMEIANLVDIVLRVVVHNVNPMNCKSEIVGTSFIFPKQKHLFIACRDN